MSQQPPEGAYAQPQDPWEGGYEPGLASVPTDPIPEQRLEGYPHDVWSQQTVAQGGYVAQQPARSRTGMIVLIVLAVLVLGVGGGYAAYYVTSKRTPVAGPSGGPSSDPVTTTTSDGSAPFDPYSVKQDDCIRNNSGQVPDPETVDPNPQIEIVPCSTESAYKVIKIVMGEELLENAEGRLDQNTTAPAACKDTGYRFWYAYDARDNTKDLFFCLIEANAS